MRRGRGAKRESRDPMERECDPVGELGQLIAARRSVRGARLLGDFLLQGGQLRNAMMNILAFGRSPVAGQSGYYLEQAHDDEYSQDDEAYGVEDQPCAVVEELSD